MDWDFTKLEIQDNTHLSALASSSSGSTHGGVIHHHHHQHENDNMVDHDIFSVDLKLGRVMDDHHQHHRHSQYGAGPTMEGAAFNPTNYSCAQQTMSLMAAAAASGSAPPQQLLHVSRRSRGGNSGGSLQPVCCLVDGCSSDLSGCREYHRRHRVCERHSKTPVVLVGGEEQRFCQQCSRFHPLCEFDEVKRSCRKRLDGHNRRRRKTQPDPTTLCNMNSSTSPVHNTGIFTPSPGSALMDFIRNAPHLPVFPPPTAWPTPLQQARTTQHVDFLLPSSSSSSSSPPSSYPFMAPYGFGGDQIATRQRAPPPPPPPQPMMMMSMMTNHTQHPPVLDNSGNMSTNHDNNINCALSLLSSTTAMDTTAPGAGVNNRSSSPLLGHPFLADHHHLFSDYTTPAATYATAGVFQHHSAAGETHDLIHQRNHHHGGGGAFGLTDTDGF